LACYIKLLQQLLLVEAQRHLFTYVITTTLTISKAKKHTAENYREKRFFYNNNLINNRVANKETLTRGTFKK